MNKLLVGMPDKETLEYGISSVFRLNGYGRSVVRILDRQANVYKSTCPSEIVTCQFDDGSKLRLLCKYAVEYGYNTFSHRGGVAYEVEVYRDVLQPLQVSTPAFHGAHIDKTTGQTWLILDYLDKSIRVNKEPATMGLTARWIGQFHAANEKLMQSASIPTLNTYDADYYIGWARRTSQFAGHWHQHFPWLDALCERFEELVNSLLAPKPTIIHGEYTPENILIRNGIIYPVDWESAAIAVGEIDLAMLTDGWDPETIQQCEIEYKRVRWPAGVPTNFERTLNTARLYVQFRWLGDRPERTTHKDMLWRFKKLRSASERLGIKE
jgi:thiamine kinase-like enzyme